MRVLAFMTVAALALPVAAFADPTAATTTASGANSTYAPTMTAEPAPVAAAPAPATAAPAAPAAPAQTASAVNLDEVVCRDSAPATGTRLGGGRECHTVRQWDERERQDQRMLQQQQAVGSNISH